MHITINPLIWHTVCFEALWWSFKVHIVKAQPRLHVGSNILLSWCKNALSATWTSWCKNALRATQTFQCKNTLSVTWTSGCKNVLSATWTSQCKNALRVTQIAWCKNGLSAKSWFFRRANKLKWDSFLLFYWPFSITKIYFCMFKLHVLHNAIDIVWSDSFSYCTHILFAKITRLDGEYL